MLFPVGGPGCAVTGAATPPRGTGQMRCRIRRHAAARSRALRAAAARVPLPVLAAVAWAACRGLSAAAVLALIMGAAAVLPAVMALVLPGTLAGLVPRRVLARRRQGRERPPVPARLRRAILAADRHRCVFCGRRADLQLDHIRPWSGGGLSAAWNLAVLCAGCNLAKSNYWKDRDGYVHYRGFPGAGNPVLASAILRAERRRRLSPARWARALRAS